MSEENCLIVFKEKQSVNEAQGRCMLSYFCGALRYVTHLSVVQAIILHHLAGV